VSLGCPGPGDMLRHLHVSMLRPAGASRVSLSSISAEALWEKSGRLDKVASEVRAYLSRCLWHTLRMLTWLITAALQVLRP
jgi:hypothetical protein